MKKLFFLALTAIVAAGAYAQTFYLPCHTDQLVGTGLTNQDNTANTGCHQNTDANSYMEVFCWDGDNPGIVSIEDVAGTPVVVAQAIPGIHDFGVPDDPDIVTWYDGNIDSMQALVVFIDDSAGVRRPGVVLMRYDAGGNFWNTWGFDLEASHTAANSPNIDINDDGRSVVTWENNGSIYGKTVGTLTSSTLSLGSLVTVHGAGGGSAFDSPDIAISNNGDIVSVCYIGRAGTNKRLYVRQGTLTNFNSGSITSSPGQITQIGSGEDYGEPRIAAPSTDALGSCAGGASNCSNDFVVVLPYTDGSGDYFIEAYGEWEGSSYDRSEANNEALNNDPGGPDITCYPSDRPVVTWPNVGPVFAWYVDYDASCDDILGNFGSAGGCIGGSGHASNPSEHILVKYLEHDLDWDDNNQQDAYSVFNQGMDSSFMDPSLSYGNNLTQPVLYTAFEADNQRLYYKHQDRTAPNLKWDPDGSAARVTAVYPNPSRSWYQVNRSAIPDGLSSVSVCDQLGRVYAAEIRYEVNGSLQIGLREAPAGIYYITLTGVVDSRTFEIVQSSR
jgi:hypothetical protein